MKCETLVEAFGDSGTTLTVNRESGVISGVKILGLESLNGRSYLPEAARNAVSLYEGAKVNVDHPARGKEREPRSYEARIGDFRNVQYLEGKGLYGNFHFNPKHALAEQLAWDAEHAPHRLGMSHVVEAKTSQRGGKTVVESISRVQSVDLVADPATTSGLFESIQNEEPAMSLTLESLEKDHPELLEAYQAKLSKSEAAKARDAEFKALQEQVAAFEAKEAAAALETEIDELLEGAGVTGNDKLRASLRKISDADSRKALVESIQEQISESRKPSGKPRSKEQTKFDGEPLTTEAVVSRLYR